MWGLKSVGITPPTQNSHLDLCTKTVGFSLSLVLEILLIIYEIIY